MKRMKLPQHKDRVMLRANGARLQIEHTGLPSGDGAYDWSCLVIGPAEARWLGSKLTQWADGELGTP